VVVAVIILVWHRQSYRLGRDERHTRRGASHTGGGGH